MYFGLFLFSFVNIYWGGYMSNMVKVIVFSVSSYFVLFVFAKILGKKQIAELDFTDYVVGITIGSIAGEWAVETQDPWYHFLIAITIFVLFSYLVSLIESRVYAFKKLLRGSPVIVIDQGKLVYKNLRKSNIDVHDVLGMCREKGYFDLSEIAYAIFETSGEMSVLPKGQNKPTEIKDLLNPQIEQSNLTKSVVIGGKPNMDVLKEINHDIDWLLKRLGLTKQKQLKKILYASYDMNNDSFDIHKIS